MRKLSKVFDVLCFVSSSYCNSNSYCVNQEGWTAHTTYKCECHTGYEAWVAHQGCRDINECCNKAHAYCNHTCQRSGSNHNHGVCYNTAASFDCRSCSVWGIKHFSDSGVITSHSSWPYGYYSASMRQNWHIKYRIQSACNGDMSAIFFENCRVTDGKRVRIKVTDFRFSWRYSDYFYITWEICNYGFFSYDVRLDYRPCCLPVRPPPLFH